MGKYDGILLVSDIDGTLIGDKFEVSDENARAIKYFTDNGGLFTLATGRMKPAIEKLTHNIVINAPIISHNGAIIYDTDMNNVLWGVPISDEEIIIVDDLNINMPDVGIKIYNENNIYLCKKNLKAEPYLSDEPEIDFRAAIKPWYKVLFIEEKSKMQKLRSYISSKGYDKKMYFSQSCDVFYEMLDKNAGKGRAIFQLKSMLPQITKVYAVGDNENDIEMIKAADVGIATENALDIVKSKADKITIDCRYNAIADIIERII